jgi:hypothetical protein
MSRPTPSQRLLARLAAMGVPIEDGATIVRTYAGYWQKKQGAWIWRVESGPHGVPAKPVGSGFRATDLLRGPLAAHWDNSIQEWTIEPHKPGTVYKPHYAITTLIERGERHQ